MAGTTSTGEGAVPLVDRRGTRAATAATGGGGAGAGERAGISDGWSSSLSPVAKTE
jgi:hypothetical protein